MPSKTGIIILAAGSSSRLGEPKQLLKLNGQALLEHAIAAAKKSKCDYSIVVLGANKEQVLPIVEGSQLSIVVNHHWSEGLASSIHAGIEHLIKERPDIDAAILMLCDQPYVEAEILDNLIKVHRESNKEGIVACTYGDTVGTPALFSKRFFEELLGLNGEEGAKRLLFEHKDQVLTVPFPKGVVDIDTKEDVLRISSESNLN